MRLKVIVAVVGLLVGGAIASALILHNDTVQINPGYLWVDNDGAGFARVHFAASDPTFSEPWMAMRDTGGYPA